MTPHAERILERVSRSCSLDRVFVAGEESAAIADQLRLRGASIEESRATTLVGATGDLLVAARTPCSLAIVCVTAKGLGDEDARYLFAALRRATSAAYVWVSAGNTPHHLEDIGSRGWWEHHAVASGFRRHPAFVHLMTYEELDVRGVAPWLLLEAVPHRSESSLDDLRSVAPSADAALWRYGRASHFVRRHDRVLDLDCGVGAGLSILKRALADSIVGIVRSQADLGYAVAHYGTSDRALEFRLGSPADLSQCPAESFDVVMVCRPLPSIFWSAESLEEIRRVLTPGGRLICSVAEEDLAVRCRIADAFLLERVLGQVGLSDGSGMRRWHEIEIDGPHERQSVDWWFFVAMKDPLRGTAATYQERLYPHAAFPGGPNPTRYVSSFENPWLHASVFNIGARVTRERLLEHLCRDVVRESPHSVDAAGAYCVLGYQLLQAPRVDSDAIQTWLEEVAMCLGALIDGAPATVRWRVSLLFIAGRLAMRTSDNTEALRCLRACMSEDATRFSSLLATKTIEAAYWAGLLCARSGDVDSARHAWSRGVDIAKSCITAEAALPRDPSAAIELLGFREFSYVFDIAGRCAAGLAALVAGARWEQRLWALLPQASISHGWSAAVNESRWALEDARSRAQEAMFALHWQRDLQLLDVKASTNDALLRQIVHRCRASERSVVVWGAGAAGRRVLNLVLDVGGVIDAFVDSNVAKHGTSVAGRPVIAPQMLFSSEWLGSFVLIGSMHAAEIEGRLLQSGLQRHDDFMKVDLDLVGAPTR